MQKFKKEALQLLADERDRKFQNEGRSESLVTTKAGVFAVKIASENAMEVKLGKGDGDKNCVTKKGKRNRSRKDIHPSVISCLSRYFPTDKRYTYVYVRLPHFRFILLGL